LPGSVGNCRTPLTKPRSSPPECRAHLQAAFCNLQFGVDIPRRRRQLTTRFGLIGPYLSAAAIKLKRNPAGPLEWGRAPPVSSESSADLAQSPDFARSALGCLWAVPHRLCHEEGRRIRNEWGFV